MFLRERKKRKAACCLLIMVILMASSSEGKKTKCTGFDELPTRRYINHKGENITLTLESSPRITHQMATHVFKIVLQELLGYVNVRIVTREDDFNITNVINRFMTDVNYTRRSTPLSMINLEAWLPSTYDLTEDIVMKFVDDLGALRKPGYLGWFIPRDMLNSLSSNKATEGIHYSEFQDQQFASLFDINPAIFARYLDSRVSKLTNKHCAKCNNGTFVPEQCQNKPCAWLLAPDYGSTSFVVDHILQLKLQVKVAWLDSELDAALTDLRSQYRVHGIQKSLMVLTWYPSEIVTNSSDFLKVTFNLCDFNSDDDDDDFGCEYEIRRIVKMSWPIVKRIAPSVNQMLQSTVLTEKDYQTLIATYKSNPGAGYADLACEWIKKHDSWKNWTSRKYIEEIYIGGIFPYTSSDDFSIKWAADMAVEAINSNSSILQNYKVLIKAHNGNCSVDTVLTSFIDYIKFDKFNHLVGVLGPACTETVEPLAAVSKHYNSLIISFSAEGADYSDRDKYPYFFRTIGENIQYKHVYLALFKQLGWKRVAALTKDGQKYTEYVTHLETLLAANNITFIANSKFPEDRDHSLIPRYLEDLKAKRARIIIADTFASDARTIMCSAYKLQMTAKEGYVWFLTHWLDEHWYDTDNINENVNCTTAEMLQAIDGYLTMTSAYFASNESVMQENITVQQWRDKYALRTSKLSNYAGYVYDAIWTYAYALDKLLKDFPEIYADFHSENSTKKLVQAINETDFHGVSGEIKFRGGASRVSIIDLMQFRNGTLNLVGHYYPNFTDAKKVIPHGKLMLNESSIIWLTEDGKKPNDGALPSSCALEGLANFLNVECYQAVIYLNVFVISLLVISLVSAFLVMKRRYEKREQLTQKYMRSLGIDLINGCKIADLDKWEVPKECIILNRKIGEGAFGKVYGGEADFGKGWQAVAVKALKVGSTNEEQLDFLAEAEIMKRFTHKNIVELLGVCTKSEPVYVIMEFMLYGDLKTFLLGRRHLVNSKHDEAAEDISSKKLTSMALDVARGLSYLAEMKYVHRDLASRNCLINANRVVKIADFGMTRPMFDNGCYTFHRKGKLPVRWMAPESLALGHFTPSSDVWSYGVLLYEVITFGSFPFQGMSNNEVLDYVIAGNTLPIPPGCRSQLEALLKSCWNKELTVRPKASEIVEYIANNPRLLTACLDVPLASVQMEEDTAPMDITMDTSPFRKCSSTFSFKSSMPNGINFDTNLSVKAIDEGNHSIQLENCATEPLLPDYRLSERTDSGFEHEEQELLDAIPNGHAMTIL